MILADKIIMLRKKNGWSQEELAERLEVSRQSVSKWEGRLSVPDMNKIIGMSALFGVSTDYLLKDELEEITPSESQATDDDTGSVRTVDAEEANRYLSVVDRVSRRIAIGVMLCILSPVCLILLAGLSEQPNAPITENLAAALGLTVLFLLVGAAVALFIVNGMQLSEFSYLDKECIALGYGVKGIVEKKRDAYSKKFVASLTVAVLFCMFSVVPLIVFGALEAEEMVLVACTAEILVICSVAVAVIVRISYISGSHQRLLQTGEFSREQKRSRVKNEALETAYWSLMTALYLIVSFLTGAWHITWVIWPIAGCVYPLLQLAVEALHKNDKE